MPPPKAPAENMNPLQDRPSAPAFAPGDTVAMAWEGDGDAAFTLVAARSITGWIGRC